MDTTSSWKFAGWMDCPIAQQKSQYSRYCLSEATWMILFPIIFFPLCKFKPVLNYWLTPKGTFKELRIFRFLECSWYLKGFFRSILNIQILKIVSSEPQERTIHFNKIILEKANDPMFPLKNCFKREVGYRVYCRNKLRELLKYQFQTIWYLNGFFYSVFFLFGYQTNRRIAAFKVSRVY